MTKATATPAKATETKGKGKNTVVNKTPENATPAKRVRKTAAKPETVAPTVPAVETKAAPAPADPVPTVVQEVKRGAGRPLSADAAKVRRRVLSAFSKMLAAGEIEVTVKGITKAVKLRKVTVSNTIRWAEGENILQRVGYKLKTTPGRKEVFYTLNKVKLAEATANAA